MSRVTKSVQFQPGDVLLYRTTTWMGRAIRMLDGAEVSHAALFLGDDEVAEALVKPGLVRQSIEKSIEKDRHTRYSAPHPGKGKRNSDP